VEDTITNGDKIKLEDFNGCFAIGGCQRYLKLLTRLAGGFDIDNPLLKPDVLADMKVIGISVEVCAYVISDWERVNRSRVWVIAECVGIFTIICPQAWIAPRFQRRLRQPVSPYCSTLCTPVSVIGYSPDSIPSIPLVTIGATGSSNGLHLASVVRN